MLHGVSAHPPSEGLSGHPEQAWTVLDVDRATPLEAQWAVGSHGTQGKIDWKGSLALSTGDTDGNRLIQV